MQLRCISEHLPPEESLILNFFDWFSSLCNVWDWYLWPAFSFNFLKNANSEVLGPSAACYIQMEWLIFSNTSSNYFWLVPLEIQHNYDNRACIYLNMDSSFVFYNHDHVRAQLSVVHYNIVFSVKLTTQLLYK